MTDQEDKEQDSKIDQSKNLNDTPSIEDIRERINEQPGPISFEIGTCPKPTFAWFKKEAKEKYADNYGLALTMMKEKIQALEKKDEEIEMLRKRISRLEEDIDEFVQALNEADDDNSRGTLNTDREN